MIGFCVFLYLGYYLPFKAEQIMSEKERNADKYAQLERQKLSGIQYFIIRGLTSFDNFNRRMCHVNPD